MTNEQVQSILDKLDSMEENIVESIKEAGNLIVKMIKEDAELNLEKLK